MKFDFLKYIYRYMQIFLLCWIKSLTMRWTVWVLFYSPAMNDCFLIKKKHVHTTHFSIKGKNCSNAFLSLNYTFEFKQLFLWLERFFWDWKHTFNWSNIFFLIEWRNRNSSIVHLKRTGNHTCIHIQVSQESLPALESWWIKRDFKLALFALCFLTG